MQASRLLLYASPCTSHPSVPVAVYHYCFAVVKVQQAGLVASTLGAQPHTKDYLATQLPHNKHHKRGSRRTTAKFKLCDDEADAAQLRTYIRTWYIIITSVSPQSLLFLHRHLLLILVRGRNTPNPHPRYYYY